MSTKPTVSSEELLAELLRSKLIKSAELKEKQARLLDILKDKAELQKVKKGGSRC